MDTNKHETHFLYLRQFQSLKAAPTADEQESMRERLGLDKAYEPEKSADYICYFITAITIINIIGLSFSCIRIIKPVLFQATVIVLFGATLIS